MGSELGLSDEKILALGDYATSKLYDEVERLTLEYADCMTITGREVSDEMFSRLREVYAEDALVELTATCRLSPSLFGREENELRQQRRFGS